MEIAQKIWPDAIWKVPSKHRYLNESLYVENRTIHHFSS